MISPWKGFLIAVFLFGVHAASAATFTVNKSGNGYGTDTHDVAPGNGVCSDSSGFCSLRAAIEETNALSTADTINLPAGTFTAETGPLVVASGANLTINGTGSTTSIVQGETSSAFAFHSVFQVSTGAIFNLNLVQITNGRSVKGGGLQILGNNTVNIFNCLFVQNLASSPRAPAGDVTGGAIYSFNSALTLTSVTLRQNSAVSPPGQKAKGAGLFVQGGSLNMSYSLVEKNNSSDASTTPAPANLGVGIALIDVGSASITNSQISQNTSSSTQGVRGLGVYISGTGANSNVLISNSTITGNAAMNGFDNRGAGIAIDGAASGSVTIDQSTISANSVYGTGLGGGVYFDPSGPSQMNLMISNSTISGNATGYRGGGMFITNSGSASTSGRGIVTLQNSTVSGNISVQEGGGIVFGSGNVAANPFQLDLKFATVASNQANVDQYGTEGGGGLYVFSGRATLMNSIIANNVVYGQTTAYDIKGSVILQDYNHIGIISESSLVNFNSTDTVGAAALGPLQNNGGPTFTHLPTNFGSLVDAIPAGVNGCGSTFLRDQRVSFNRVWGGKCDKGATERTYLF
jgi:hypothetical protein